MWALIPKILTYGAPVILWIFRTRGDLRLRPRANLKADCEMLTLLRTVDVASCSTLEAHIDAQVARLYGQGAPTPSWLTRIRRDVAKPRVLVALVVLALGVGGTAYLVRNGFSWWSLLTVYLAFLGLGLLTSGLDTRRELSTVYTELGETVFEVFKDKPLDPAVDPLLQRIAALREQIGQREPTPAAQPVTGSP